MLHASMPSRVHQAKPTTTIPQHGQASTKPKTEGHICATHEHVKPAGTHAPAIRLASAYRHHHSPPAHRARSQESARASEAIELALQRQARTPDADSALPKTKDRNLITLLRLHPAAPQPRR